MVIQSLSHNCHPSWLNGPPYAVEEVVFDENELVGCFRTEVELLRDGESD